MEAERDGHGRFLKGHKSYWETERIIFTCHNCKKEFKTERSTKYRRFCSRECCLKFYAGIPREYTGSYINCLNCEKSFYVKPCLLKKTKFCSKECNNIWRKGKYFGDGKSLFKKGHKSHSTGKDYETLYGKERAKKLTELNKKNRLDNWSDLDYRKKQMKTRTPDKLKEFREGAKKYREENKDKIDKRLDTMRIENTKKRRQWIK